MNMQFVGIKEFRQDISGFVKKARAKNARYVIMNRNTPLFEITPFAEKENMSSLLKAIMEGKEDARAGRVHTERAILKEFS